jgi:Ca2+-binding RTX toxin-like protein
MAVTASFIPATGLLTEFGDTLDNTIVTSRDAAGNILINGGAVAIAGGAPTVANTSLVQAFGQDGGDTITLDESSGALPAAEFFGGAGNDTLTGGSGADQLFGQADNDTLLGKGGNDLLFGGDGDDTLIGGDGDDQLFGEAGDDRMIWNPGDDTDLFEGGADNDTAEVNGGNGSETFTITANGARVRFDRVTPAPFSIDIGTTENLVVHANGGDDTITASNGLAALIALTLDGGAGNDTITGGDGADLILGGIGNDIVAGGRGNDTALLGNDDDTFIWNPGDGSDTVEGQGGTDTLEFNGANIGENIDVSANGSRVRFTRDIANIVMDLNSVEKINFHALGGADHITVNDLTGTGVQQVAIDLQANGGGGDAAADTVTVNATNAADDIAVTLAGAEILVNGLAAQTSIVGQEAANDALVINGLGGADVINASTLPAGQIHLTIDGGDGDDTITGSAGADTLIGGNNNDTVTGGRGDDVALLGADDDTFIWNPGDGNDVVEGQGGFDTLQFNGANIAENIDISANGGRVRLTRDVANIVMDLNDVEKIALKTLGGADAITVNDLSGTDVTQVAIDLSASGGGGDGAADTVTDNGTANADTITILQSGQNILINGLAAQVTISGQEAGDTLVINGMGGDDVINASALAAGAIKLTINGGLGDDVIIGSAGNDTVNGGDGDDVALLGDGDDTFIWNPGDDNDIVEGQSGVDTLQFNGANVAENIDISANGGRVQFFRNVANVTMDLNDVEKIAFKALGGADTITVNDLSGTDVQQVAIDLSANGGGGDGAADTVIVNGSGNADHITVTKSGQSILVNGLTAQVSISGQEAANDTVRINGLGGADVIDASSLAAGQIRLVIDGGTGNDVITGSHGNDLFSGGADDDRFIWKVGSAADIITDFTAGNGTPDKIDVRAFAGAGIHSLNDVLAHATQVGADTVIDFGGGDTLTLNNVLKSNLSTDDFIFGGASVLSVTTSGNGITAGSGDMNAGDVVTFTVTFDGAINVTGIPTLALNNGGVAVFTGGSGGAALTFQYTVANGQNTPDLAITGVDLHGGALRDGSGSDADLAGLVVNPSGILQIDTLTPHLTSITASPASGAALPGSTIHFTLGFDEAIHVAGGTPTLMLNNGQTAVFNATATAQLGDPSKLVFDYAIFDGSPRTPTLAITGLNANGASVDDFAGNHADLGDVTATFNGLSVQSPSTPAGFFFAPSPPLASLGFGDEGPHLDSMAALPAFDLRGLLAGSHEKSDHFPIAEHHTISDFHLV